MSNTDTTASKVSTLSKYWQDILEKISYKGIVSNLPYLIFVAALCVIYITNSNNCVSMIREIGKKNKELSELRWRYKDAQANLIFETSEAQITKRAKEIGILSLEKPPYEIKILNPIVEPIKKEK